MTPSLQRLAWLVATLALVVGLVVLDAARAGPATMLSGCNLALSRSDVPPADVLVVGSSRTGTAVDTVAMQRMLAAEPTVGEPTVERIALGRSPLKASVALVENYVDGRGDPRVIVFEVSFMTQRTVDRISQLDTDQAADALLFGRDVNLMRYDQLATAPVALPLTETETTLNRFRYALRGLVLRSGALAYQFVSDPTHTFSLDECSTNDRIREPEWPADFAFSWDETDRPTAPSEHIELLRAAAADDAETRQLQAWQVGRPTGLRYPYDVDEAYRSGEMALLDRAVALAAERDIPIILLLLPIYGTEAALADITALAERYGEDADVYDLYPTAEVDLSTYWYDDAHLLPKVAGELTTALLAQRLADGPLRTGPGSGDS